MIFLVQICSYLICFRVLFVCDISKSEIKMTRRRIEIIKRKRNAMQKFLRNDVADLLKNGLDSNAYGRVITSLTFLIFLYSLFSLKIKMD